MPLRSFLQTLRLSQGWSQWRQAWLTQWNQPKKRNNNFYSSNKPIIFQQWRRLIYAFRMAGDARSLILGPPYRIPLWQRYGRWKIRELK